LTNASDHFAAEILYRWERLWDVCAMSPELPVVDYALEDALEYGPETAFQHIPLFIFRRTHEGHWPSRGRFLDFQGIMIADRGHGLHLTGATSHGIFRGDVCLIGTGGDQGLTHTRGLLLYEMLFKPEIFDAETWEALRELPGFDALVFEKGASRRFHLDPSAYAEIADDLLELWTEWCVGTRANAVVVRALFLRLLVRLARLVAARRGLEVRHSERTRTPEEITAEAVRVIDRRHGAGVKVGQLAASAHLSRRHFTQVFSSVMGQPPSEYIRHVRLERSKELLVRTVLPLSEIARSTGFVDASHFAREFRTTTGLTPRAFRVESWRARREAPQGPGG
jgi:AraC-like DNA-binding protein